MSATLFPEDTLFIQRMLKAEDLYLGNLDSIWGPLTEKAANRFHELSLQIAENTAPLTHALKKTSKP